MPSLMRLLDLDIPIIQAPMAGVQDSRLAIAVSNAGALGSLPCATFTLTAMHAELVKMSAQTARPYNVNFFCHVQPEDDRARDLAWRAALAPYYQEFGLDQNEVASGPGRVAFNADTADLLREFKPAVVSFHFGLPSPELLEVVRSWGAKILSSATTVDEAIWLEKHGVDAVIAQGLEAGGHRGHFLSDDLSLQLDTFALLPKIMRAVNVPVIAAGGIANADGVRRAMALGAAAVQIGTAYLLCDEATTSAVHRAALVDPAGRHTLLTNVFSGRPARGIVNRLMRELGPISSAAPAFPLATALVGPLRTAAERFGSGDFSPLWAGKDVSGCKRSSAADLTRVLAG